MNNLDIYTHWTLDVDYSKYRVTNSDVVLYRNQDEAVNKVLSRFKEKCDQEHGIIYFIKGNRLFFTINGVKYWTILSCTAIEWEYIDSLIEDLSKIADNIAYKQGELD